MEDRDFLDDLNKLMEEHLIKVFQEDETCKDRLLITKIQKESRIIASKLHNYNEKIFDGMLEKITNDSDSHLEEQDIEKLERQLNYLGQINKLLDDLENV